MDDASGLAPGKQLGKYRLDGLLGRGGMGEVWAAHDPDLDRKVALKVLRAAASSEDARLRLLREGRAMARLRHPNVITVYEATAADGRDVIAMELIDGTSLAGWLAQRREPAAIVETLLAAGRGLAAAHAAGMIHRDFKPHNVLVDRDGRVVVTDFGLARGMTDDEPTAAGPMAPTADPVAPLDETMTAPGPARTSSTSSNDSGATTDRAALHSPLTATGALLGTPAYMAPEQLAGRPADARSDQFAFCVTAWEALAGARPFAGATLAELRDAVDAGAPNGGDQLPARLRPLLERGLAHDPGDRWPTMAALLAAIDRAWRRPRRIRIAAAVTIGALALAAIPVALWLRGGSAAPGPCPSVEDGFGAASTAALRDVDTTLAALGAPGKRFIAFLDGWQTTWKATYRKTCAAPKDPDFLARRACLDSARDKLVADARNAGHATAQILGDVDPAEVILQADGCLAHPRAMAPPPPTDPARAAEVDRIAGELVAFRGRMHATPEVLADVARLVDAARATGHDALIAEALTVEGDLLLPSGSAAACDAHDEAFTHAEKAGADLIAIEALLGQLDCAEYVPERRPHIDELIERAGNLIARIDAAPKRALLDAMHAHVLVSRFRVDDAIAMAEQARREWLALGAPIRALQAVLIEADALIQRGHPEDLRRAEVAIRAAMTAAPADAFNAQHHARRTLGEALWWLGRLDEATAILSRLSEPAPTGELDVVVHVIASDGTPADFAQVLAAVDPAGDPIRLVRTEWFPAVEARTDKTGTARLAIPRGAVILALEQSELGAAAPTAAGELTIHLAAPAYVDGTVTQPAADPPPADARAAERMQVMASATVWIDDHPWTLISPLDRDGRFHLSLLPGRGFVEVEGQTPLGDRFSTVAPVALAPGAQKVSLAIARPVTLRVIARPAIDGAVVAIAGAHAIKTWRDLARTLTATAGSFALHPSTDPATRSTAKGDVAVGDMVTLLAAPGPGPITVCALPGATSANSVVLPLVAPGPDATPPVCVAAAAVDGTTTTVVVPTRK